MKLIYKIAIPAFLALILVIVLFAFFARHSLTEALSQEEFLKANETASRKIPQYLKADNFLEPFSPSSQKQFKDFSEELQRPSIARLTIWNRDQVIVFSDLKSVIGVHSPDHQDLKRLFAEEKSFFIKKEEDTNKPVQAEIGEFLDIYIPIRISAKVVGALEIHAVIAAILAPVERHISEMSYVLITTSVLILTVVLVVVFRNIAEHKRAKEQIQRQLQRITALQEIDRAITSTLDLRTVLDVLLEKIDLVLPYSATTIRLFNNESGLLEPVACRNLDEEEWKAERWRGGRGIPNVVFETKAPVTISNVQTDPQNRDQEFFRKHGLVSYLGVPLNVKGEILGVISFYTKEEHQFDNEEIDFLVTLANQAAIAIYNARLYEELTELASNLARSNRVKDEFLSVVSHELRTPLNVVMGYTGMIKDGLLGKINPEQEKALEKVISRARDQLTMITGILQATQMEAEGVKVERHEVSLRAFLNDLRSSYEVPLGKELTLKWDYPSDLPVVQTDSEKLKHILQNLINNAIKFTEKGHVTISARCVNWTGRHVGSRQQAEGNGHVKLVEFTVVDTGVGIPKEALPVIFEKFHQVDSSETRRYGGVGIGLYIVKKFTELMGGKVEVKSEVGKGSTFTVTIPCEYHQPEASSQPTVSY